MFQATALLTTNTLSPRQGALIEWKATGVPNKIPVVRANVTSAERAKNPTQILLVVQPTT
jgi:hypothetical protein